MPTPHLHPSAITRAAESAAPVPRRWRRRAAGWALGVMLLGAGGGLALRSVAAAAPVGTGERAKPPSGGDALRVKTVVVRPGPLAETVTATGSLRAEESVELQAEVSGKITAINFREGARVRKGDLLVKLNDSELVAMLARAQARLELARQKDARFRQLARVGGVNEQDFDTVRSELAVQQAEVDLIQAQIGKTELRAPFDGVIGLRFVSEGAYVTATSNNAVRLATLQSVDNLKADFSLPEKYAGRVRPGTPVTFTLAGHERPFHGTVYACEPRIDPGTRTVLVRALCPNEGAALLPGAFATVQLALGEIDNAILVPAAAVVPGLSEKNVFVLRDGKARRQPVQTGTRTESAVQIVSGLAPGDVVIVSNLQQLRDGQAVRPLGEEPRTRVAARDGSAGGGTSGAQ